MIELTTSSLIKVNACMRGTRNIFRFRSPLVNFNQFVETFSNGDDWTRTSDPGLMNPLLYQLSYVAVSMSLLHKSEAEAILGNTYRTSSVVSA